MNKISLKYWIILFLALGLLISCNYLRFNSENIITIQANIITVSGIFAGFVIAYVAAKIFQIRNERERLKIDLDILSMKLTNFRKLLYYVVNSNNFFIRRDDIRKYEKKYIGLKFDSIHYNEGQNKEVDKFWLEDKDISTTTVDLYLSMKAIIDDTSNVPEWVFDRNKSFNYTLSQIRKYYEPSNQIWYYLDGRYQKHTEGLINDKEFNLRDTNCIREHASSIDPKFKNREVNRILLADLGSEFYEIYLPRLSEITEKIKRGIPPGLKSSVISISLIIFVGVVFPLFVSIFDLGLNLNARLTMFSGMTLIVLFFNFFYDFISTIKDEILLKE